jgi:hypothetical protein
MASFLGQAFPCLQPIGGFSISVKRLDHRSISRDRLEGLKTDNGLHPKRPNAGDIAEMTEEYPSIKHHLPRTDTLVKSPFHIRASVLNVLV